MPLRASTSAGASAGCSSRGSKYGLAEDFCRGRRGSSRVWVRSEEVASTVFCFLFRSLRDGFNRLNEKQDPEAPPHDAVGNRVRGSSEAPPDQGSWAS